MFTSQRLKTPEPFSIAPSRSSQSVKLLFSSRVASLRFHLIILRLLLTQRKSASTESLPLPTAFASQKTLSFAKRQRLPASTAFIFSLTASAKRKTDTAAWV